MQGLITLDFGNSHPHGGFFKKTPQGWTFLKSSPLENLWETMEEFGFYSDNSSAVLSEVKAHPETLSRLETQGFLITRVRDYWRGEKFAGMPVHYSKTLGEDRLIEAFYCFKNNLAPSLLINAGTYVTLDVITEKGFMGGYIIPGMRIYRESFSLGENLKSVTLDSKMKSEWPQDTATALIEGYSGFFLLARKILDDFKLKKIVLSGGAAPQWEEWVKNNTEAMSVEVQPHLIHTALKFWMTTQVEIK